MPRPLTAALLALSLVAHLLVLYLPGDDVPAPAFEVPGLDKLVHVAAFGVPALLAVLLVRRLWPALVLLVHAPVSEALQAAPGRGRPTSSGWRSGRGSPWSWRADGGPARRTAPRRGHLDLGAGSAYDPGVPSERSDAWGYSSVGRAFRSQ